MICVPKLSVAKFQKLEYLSNGLHKQRLNVSDLGRRNFSAGRRLPQSLVNREIYVSENNGGLEDQDVMKILGLGEPRPMLRLDESERPV